MPPADVAIGTLRESTGRPAGPVDSVREVEPRVSAQIGPLQPAGQRMARRLLLLVSAVLMVAALFLPLWGMTLRSVQYPEGLRMVVYPLRIAGDIHEINMLNGYIGMADISRDYFVELRILPVLFGAVAGLALLGALVDRVWTAVPPLFLLCATAVYGFWSMTRRLYDYGHDLDPTAPMDVVPFTPPMVGENQIAQFGTYAWFGWGTFLPAAAAVLLAGAVGLHVRRGHPRLVP